MVFIILSKYLSIGNFRGQGVGYGSIYDIEIAESTVYTAPLKLHSKLSKTKTISMI